ncbi:ATP-dependent helicase, partial [Bacteroides uniformis]
YKPRAFDGGGRRGGRGNGRKPGGNKNGRNNSKGGKPRAKRPQNGGEKK